MPKQNDIRNLLNIQDKHITFNHPITEKTSVKGRQALLVHATLTYTPRACKQCGVKNTNYKIYKNGTQTSVIKLPLNNHQPTYLKLRKQRFYCKECCGSFVAETSLVAPNCFISNSIKAGIVIEATRAISIKDIAERMNISWHTVIRFVRQAAKEARPYYTTLPAHLSFDEFKFKKSRMAFDYINAETGEILGIVSGTTNYQIKKHFISRFSLKERHQVKTITIDMNSGYISCIKELFPKAKIIIDRFHIVQLINRSLNKSRIKYMNQLKSQPEDRKKYRRLKTYWRLFLKKESHISYTTYKNYHLFGQRTEAGILNEMLDYDDIFRLNYNTYQSLMKAVDDNDIHLLRQLVTTVHPDLTHHLKTSLKTLAKHLNYIENTFTYTYSNGRIEGNHNKIKVLNRIAYGFRNLGNYIDRITLYFNLKPNHKKENLLAS